MDYYKTLFKIYLRIKSKEEERKINQTGGVIERVRVGPHNIEYDLQVHSTGRGKNKVIDLMAISTSRSNTKKPCFIMNIVPGGHSSLISLSRGITCFLDNVDDSTGIVLVAYEIAKQKGAKTFEFTDNSTRVVQDRKIILSDLSFLTTGKTWYERILPSIHPLNERDKTDIEKARIIVKKNKWIDVYNNLLKIYNIDVNFDTTGIDIHNEGSAMKVLDRAKKSKKYAFFFDSEMYSLLASSFVISLHGKHWIMNI